MFFGGKEYEGRFRLTGVRAVAAMIVAAWLANNHLPASVDFRGALTRSLIGAFQGLASASVAYGLMF